MFNVSLKVDNNILTELNNLCEEFCFEYADYLKSDDPDEWIVKWDNFESFRFKISKTLHKKKYDRSKSYTMSENINHWIAFREFWNWILETHNVTNSPYLDVLYRKLKLQVEHQLSQRSSLIKSNNLINSNGIVKRIN